MHTAAYDALIAQYLAPKAGLDPLGGTFTPTYEGAGHALRREPAPEGGVLPRDRLSPPGCLTEAEQLHGKALSYNNINDANGALELLQGV